MQAGLTFLCVNILFQLINFLTMRRFLDTALAGGSLELLKRLALLFIGIATEPVQRIIAGEYLARPRRGR